MSPKCSPHIAPSGVPCIRPPIPWGQTPRLPVMTVNSKAPDKSGNVIVGIPELEQLKGKVVQLENDDHAYSLLKIIAEALGMQVGAGGSWTGTAYVSLGAFATKDTIGPDDLTPELKAQLKGDPGETPTIDSALDLTSSNPVMNSVIAAELQNLRALVASQYYPEGNVKDASELTAGIKYNFGAAGSDRTVMAAPFSNTGDPENDNSGLVGRVVIPPFVDANGNPYVSDDGTRYKVVGVSAGVAVDNNASITSIIAPSTVTTISHRAFESCVVLSSVSFPYATTIGDYAFFVCNSLHSVSLPAATAVGSSAFSSCPLTSVSLPYATTIGDYAFSYCSALSSVSLPAAKTIGNGAFSYCNAIPSVSLPSATTIGEEAFNSCRSLSSVSLPAATTLGSSAFGACGSLSSVSLPTTTTIGDYAFFFCNVLSSVDFGDTPHRSVPTLGDNVFGSVPTSCKMIVPDAQYNAWVAASGWSDLVTAGYTFLRHSEWGYARKYEVENKADKPTTFTAGNLAEFDSNGNPVDSGATKYDLEPSLRFAKYYPEGNVKDVSEFTSGVKYDVPDAAARTIMVKPFSNTGDPENDNSGLIGRVVIPPFVDADGNPYISDDGTRYKVVGVNFGGSAMGTNTKLTAIIAPSTVTTIVDGAFTKCSGLTSVSLPAVALIEANAFTECSKLASVSLPSATTIGSFAFSDCASLTSVSLPAATTILNATFWGCKLLTSVSLPSATTIGNRSFSFCDKLDSVSLPVAETVGDYAFSTCTELTSVSLPAATTIGELAFDSCSGLASVDFGDTPRSSVPVIGTDTFYDVPTSCKIIVPDAQYDAWVAAPGWSDLVTAGYTFLSHSEWEDSLK